MIQLDSFYYNLHPVNISNNYFHIRISKEGQRIDLISGYSKNYKGFITNEITEYAYIKEKKEEFQQRIAKYNYFETIPLPQFKVKSIVDSFIFSNQFEIPTDSLIQNWNDRFLHCNSIQFYCKIDKRYESKNYTCLWGQEDSIAYKSVIIKNYDLIDSMLNLDSLYNNFMRKLPKGKLYSNNSYRMRFIMTDEQLKWWNKSKPRRKYLDSIKVSVDKYLNAQLTMQNIELDKVNCFENYYLKFGTNGRLKKVSVQDYDKPRLYGLFDIGEYFAEKKEIRKCKNKIKKIFRNISLNSFNLKYDVERIISFDHKSKFQLRDETMY